MPDIIPGVEPKVWDVVTPSKVGWDIIPPSKAPYSATVIEVWFPHEFHYQTAGYG